MPDDEDGGGEERLSIIDALIYAPIGLLLDGQELTPELAKRGRQQAVAARQIGELAVKSVLRRMEESQTAAKEPGEDAEAAHPDPPPADPGADSAENNGEQPTGDSRGESSREEQADPSSAHLSITDYDLLAASQVVKRLDALSPEDLEAVRIYEASTRDRRTILHKISRLQGE